VDRDGSCELQRSQSVPYQFAKVEYIHRSPDIILFHDFVSQREAEQLREMAVRKVSYMLTLYLLFNSRSYLK